MCGICTRLNQNPFGECRIPTYPCALPRVQLRLLSQGPLAIFQVLELHANCAIGRPVGGDPVKLVEAVRPVRAETILLPRLRPREGKVRREDSILSSVVANVNTKNGFPCFWVCPCTNSLSALRDRAWFLRPFSGAYPFFFRINRSLSHEQPAGCRVRDSVVLDQVRHSTVTFVPSFHQLIIFSI